MAAVTIEDLLRDPEPVHIRTGKRAKDGSDQEVVVYLRPPTDTEKSICMGAANGARRALRKKLEDPTSDEHKYMLRAQLEDADPQQLRNIWINGHLIERMAQINFESLEEREYVPEPEGDIIPAKAQDAYEDEVEEAEARRQKLLIEALGSIRNELEREAAALPEASLIENAMPAHIEALAQQTWTQTYADQNIARCTYSDKKRTKLYFKTIEQVQKLREQMPRVVEQLANAHAALLLPVEPDLGF